LAQPKQWKMDKSMDGRGLGVDVRITLRLILQKHGVRVKVKLSLFLIKQHAMKMCPLLN